MTSKKLRQIRIKLGFTQENMAAALNKMSVRTYQKWEQGLHPIKPVVSLAVNFMAKTANLKEGKRGK